VSRRQGPSDQIRNGHTAALKCCIQRRYSSDVGRKSRLKRERAASTPSAEPDERPALLAEAPATIELPAPIAPPVKRRAVRSRKKRPVGARVARVAVDDATWEAFKKLCGYTPASIRLGRMVLAEVERARQPFTSTDAVSAVEAIRVHLDELEALARRR